MIYHNILDYEKTSRIICYLVGIIIETCNKLQLHFDFIHWFRMKVCLDIIVKDITKTRQLFFPWTHELCLHMILWVTGSLTKYDQESIFSNRIQNVSWVGKAMHPENFKVNLADCTFVHRKLRTKWRLFVQMVANLCKVNIWYLFFKVFLFL